MPRRDDIPYVLRARHSPSHAPSPGADAAGALEEALGFPARLLTRLPSRSTFVVYAADLPNEISVVTKELPEPRESPAGAVVLDGVELDALVAGVEAERFLAADLRRLCQAKLADPGHRLTPEAALDGAQPVGASMTLETLLRRLEVALAGVDVAPLGSPDDLTQAA